MVSEMLKICFYMLFLEPFHVYDLFCYQVLCCWTSILEDNIQTDIQQMLSYYFSSASNPWMVQFEQAHIIFDLLFYA